MGNLSRPIEKLVARITAQCATGKILAGFNFEPVPIPSTEGAKDLPALRLYIPGVTETTRGNAFAVPTLTVNILLATRRTTDAIVEHMKALEKLLDVLDSDANGNLDTHLEGSLRQPISFRVTSQYVLDLSVNSELTLTLEPRAAARGSRR